MTLKNLSTEERRFRYDDCRYMDCGRLWTLQISPDILTQGVEKLNCGKVGRPFVFSNACFAAAFLFRNATNIRYRQIQGVAEAMVGRENAPTYSAFQKAWRKESGYNDRWSVEIAFSTFKRVLGECISARKLENVKTGIYGKVYLYNRMIDMAIDSGYGTPRIVQVYKPGPKTTKNEGGKR